MGICIIHQFVTGKIIDNFVIQMHPFFTYFSVVGFDCCIGSVSQKNLFVLKFETGKYRPLSTLHIVLV